MTQAKLCGEILVEDMTSQEKERAQRIQEILPELRAVSADSDKKGAFNLANLELFKSNGLTGLLVPKEYGGLGGGLRDLTAACFALGTVCPSTALCFFFHCSTSSRGLLALDAIAAELFNKEEVPLVKSFAQKILFRMGKEKCWFSNFASEFVKSEKAAVTISTTARKVAGGYLLNGVKSFGCSTGVSDFYLLTAQLEGYSDAAGLATFMVPRLSTGVKERHKWDSIGMRATATHGITLTDVFVPAEEALTLPSAFTKMMSMSRGSFVGNQIAGNAVYLGKAFDVYEHTISQLCARKFQDTGRCIGESPMHQEIVGKMAQNLETAMLWLRRQLQLETSEPPLLPKEEVIKNWRLCKGTVADAAFEIAVAALKAGGTSVTQNTSIEARALRDLSMGLVQAFPSERGRLEAAKMIIAKEKQTLFC